MAYRLLYHPDVARDDLPPVPTTIRSRIRKAIETRLAIDPVRYGLPLRKSLKGHRKLRVGDWRVIYKVAGTDIIILKIGNRKEVYQEAIRRMVI